MSDRERIKTEAHYEGNSGNGGNGGPWGEAHPIDAWVERVPTRIVPADTDYGGMYEDRDNSWRNQPDITSTFDYYSSVSRSSEAPCNDMNELQNLLQGWEDLYSGPHKANLSARRDAVCDLALGGAVSCSRCSALPRIA
jgi:hypothetical protein